MSAGMLRTADITSLPKKFASIDIDALHAAALRLDRPVGDLQSGHFRDQRAGVRPERHLVGRGAVGERVAANRRPECRNLDHHVVDGLGAGCEPQRIERHGGRSDPQVGAQRVVTQRSDGQAVFASRHTGEESPAVDVRGGVGAAAAVSVRLRSSATAPTTASRVARSATRKRTVTDCAAAVAAQSRQNSKSGSVFPGFIGLRRGSVAKDSDLDLSVPLFFGCLWHIGTPFDEF